MAIPPDDDPGFPQGEDSPPIQGKKPSDRKRRREEERTLSDDIDLEEGGDVRRQHFPEETERAQRAAERRKRREEAIGAQDKEMDFEARQEHDRNRARAARELELPRDLPEAASTDIDESAEAEARRRRATERRERLEREAKEAPRRKKTEEARTPQSARFSLRNLSTVEKILLPLALLCVVAGLMYVGNLIRKAASESVAGESLPVLKTPIQGGLLSIADVEMAWRDRRQSDKGNRDAIRLPEIKITLANATSNSFLQVIFRNENDRIKGDAPTLKLGNGTFVDSSSPTMIISGTDGFDNPALFLDYRSGGEIEWSVEILESNSYTASVNEWKSLGKYLMTPKYRPDGLMP